MKVQVYTDGPARVFAPRVLTMVCELNATDREATEAAMRKLGHQRISRWVRTDWGYEARFGLIHSRPAQSNEQEKP